MREDKKKECIIRFSSLLAAIPHGWIAGGAVRDHFASMSLSSDIDIFFATKAKFTEAVELTKKNTAFKPQYTHDTLAAFTWQGKTVQFIGTHFFNSPEETIANFDFTVCSCAVDTENVYLHPHFFEDLAARRLAINELPFPLSTLERMIKYIKRGFTPCNGTLLTLSKAIAEVDLGDKVNTLSFYPNGSPRFIRFD